MTAMQWIIYICIKTAAFYRLSDVSLWETRKQKGSSLTVRGDFVRRVEPAVSTWWGADVHVEMDVVSQPVAALFVVHKYRLLPVLWPFTLAASKGKDNKEEGDWWDKKKHLSQQRTQISTFLFQWWSELTWTEMDTDPLSDHSQFSSCHTESWTLLRLSR